MNNWILKILGAALLVITGYQAPAVWIAVSSVVVAGYVAALAISPFLVAFFQNPRFADKVKRMLAVLAALAISALLSAPFVLLHLSRISYFNH